MWLSFLVVAGGGAPAAPDDWAAPNDPAYARYPADPHQESLFLLRMEEAWRLEKGSPKVVVGIIDLAFDPAHPDLKGKLWTNPGEVPGNGVDDDRNGFVDDIHGWDFLGNDATLQGEGMEHGTHVAGILGAETNNGIGIAGMAPNCPLMLVKVGLPGCLTDGDLMARAIRYCVDNGARLICMNHGLSEYYPGWHVPVNSALKAACDDAYRRNVLVITCTTSNDGVFYPATFPPSYDSAMGTGASDIAGKPSSMYGGSLFCEAIAPGGERIGGDDHNHRSVYSCYCGDRAYHYYAGGCMATPHVVGLMALVLSHYPGIDVEQARQIVRNTARGEREGFQPRWGHGLIQPVAALSLPPNRIAALPALAGSQVAAGKDEDGRPVYRVAVRNVGALDARVRVSLFAGTRKVAEQVARVPGLEQAQVAFPADGLPPAARLTARLRSLGVDRPRIFTKTPDIRLSLTDEDLFLRRGPSGREVLGVRVHNDGSAGAGRVAVILHRYEPAVPNRQGPASAMLAATVIAVPAHGSAVAWLATPTPPNLGGLVGAGPAMDDLWAEVECLEVGAPHVGRAKAKARLQRERTAARGAPARSVASFRFDAGASDTVASGELQARLSGARWTQDGPVKCLELDGESAHLEVEDHPRLAGMPSLRLDVRAKCTGPLAALEPLAYKWLKGGQSASFGLALLNGHPYCLIQTAATGFAEVVCDDLSVAPGEWHTVSLVYTGSLLTAEVDGRRSTVSRPAAGAVAHCPQPLLLGAAADKAGKPALFLRGRLAEVRLTTLGIEARPAAVLGKVDTKQVVRLLPAGGTERLWLEVGPNPPAPPNSGGTGPGSPPAPPNSGGTGPGSPPAPQNSGGTAAGSAHKPTGRVVVRDTRGTALPGGSPHTDQGLLQIGNRQSPIGDHDGSPRVRGAGRSGSPRVRGAGRSGSPRVRGAGRSGSPRVRRAGRSGSPRVRGAGRSGSPRVRGAGRSGSPRVWRAGRSGSPRVWRAGRSGSPRVRGAGGAANLRITLAFLEAPPSAAIHLSLYAADGSGQPAKSVLTPAQPTWRGPLPAGRYVLELRSSRRVAYTLDVAGAADVWQHRFHATDRGAGAPAAYTAWLETPTPGAGSFEIYDCSEGARILLSPDGRGVQAITQPGGVMGDSSERLGGARVWKRHTFAAAAGAWLHYPSRINASGDYAVRSTAAIHWRRPPEAVRDAFAASPTLRLLAVRMAGGAITAANRSARYREAADRGLHFLDTLTETVESGARVYERWHVDDNAPRVYWGCDGQMLCARTYYDAYRQTGDERWKQRALEVARWVLRHQKREPGDARFGAIPYGFVGPGAEISWGSSNNIQGKILYGLSQLAAWSDEPDLLDALRLNADYYARVQYENGRWPHFVEKAPQSVCGYPTAWGVAGLLVAYEKLGEARYLQSAERGLAAYVRGLQPDGSILCHCNHAGADEDDHAIRSSLTMLTPFALAYRTTKKPEYRRVLDRLYLFLASVRHPSGVYKPRGNDCVNLIYAQNWGVQGFCEAYEATGDRKFLRAALGLADFFARTQLRSPDPHFDGAWVANYNVAKGFPGGYMDDEGNCFDLYTSWGAAPIVYGIQRLVSVLR